MNTEENIKDLHFDIDNLKGIIRMLKFKNKYIEKQLTENNIDYKFYCWDEVSLGEKRRCENECDKCKTNFKNNP